jgi:aryl-alcohol dehydrogenase-like predicted oxidoreductase
MEKRKLGSSELEIVPLALGTNVFGWTIDEKRSFEVLDAFLDGGFNFLDTADVYSNWHAGNKGGESETIIGNWMRSRHCRDKIVLATKVGGDMGQGKVCLSRAHIIQAAEASLKRLQTDYIDLYQSHWDDRETPLEETLDAYAQLVKEGKVRVIGASNISRERLELALTTSNEKGLPRYDTLQPEYNLYAREGFEKDQQAFCVENGIGVIPYFGLASGFLTGKYRVASDAGKSSRGQGIVDKYLNERGQRILAALDEVALQYHTNMASVALAWLMAQPAVTAPIASATSVAQLAELAKMVELKLVGSTMEHLRTASAYQ